MGDVRLLVELGRLETERVDNVVDLGGTLLKVLSGLLGGSVGTGVWVIVLVFLLQQQLRGTGQLTDGDSTLGDHGTVNLVDNVIDLNWIERVGYDLVSRNNILFSRQLASCPQRQKRCN